MGTRDVGLQSFTTRTGDWTNWTLPQNKPKEKVKATTSTASQLLLLIDIYQLLRSKDNLQIWHFVAAGSDIVEVGRGRIDLIPTRYRRHHLVDAARKPNPRGNYDLLKTRTKKRRVRTLAAGEMPEERDEGTEEAAWGFIG